jgi:hypothetical protein
MTDQTVNQNPKVSTEPVNEAAQKKTGFVSKLKGFFVDEVDPMTSPLEKTKEVSKTDEAPQSIVKEVVSPEIINEASSESTAVKDVVPDVALPEITTAVSKENSVADDIVDPKTPEVKGVTEAKKTSDNSEDTKESTSPPSTPKKIDAPIGKEGHQNIIFGTGINLLLTQTKEEVVVEAKKFKLNLSSIFTLVIFVTVTIVVFGINIAFKLSYNVQAKEIEQLEETISQDYYLIEANNKILDRLLFMKDLNETNYSPKIVLNFLNDLTEEYGQILSFTLTTDLEFTLVGSTSSYETASKLWHLMVVNDDIETVTIRSISKTDNTQVFVTFEGNLKYNSFVKLLETQDGVTE